MNERSRFDLIITGCGIAGASLAYFLSELGMTDILILEKEEMPGYHATGRAASVLAEFDFVPSTLQLKILGAQFLRNPPNGFSDNPLLYETGILITMQGQLWQEALQLASDLTTRGVVFDLLTPDQAVSTVPALLREDLDGAVRLSRDGHLDVHELLWSYLRHARKKGAVLRCREEVRDLIVEKGVCRGVITDSGRYESRWVVDAAGAWAERIRGLAGPSPVELTPFRRTVISFAAPTAVDVAAWPFTVNLTHEFYFAPESAGMFASPMDQDPHEPCDARPDEWLVAQTVDRLKQFAPVLTPKSIMRKWAGLRTFSPDHEMVVGEDPNLKGFFWLAGQGGAGIETSPAVGRMAAELIVKGKSEIMEGLWLSPERFVHP